MTTAVTENISSSFHVNGTQKSQKGFMTRIDIGTYITISPETTKLLSPQKLLDSLPMTNCMNAVSLPFAVDQVHCTYEYDVVRCASHSQSCYCFHVYVTRDWASVSVLVSRAFQYNGISSSSVCFYDGLCYGNNNKRINKITPKDEKRKAKNPKTEKKQNNKKSELHI